MGTWYVAGVPYSDELYHYGILGQKWGVRRFQNKDGTLTAAGKERYGYKNEGKKKVTKDEKFSGKEWTNENTIDNENDFEYYAWEYQDDPNVKKAFESAINDNSNAKELDRMAKSYFNKDKEYIDSWVNYSSIAAKKMGDLPENLNEDEIEDRVFKDNPQYSTLKQSHAISREELFKAISNSVDNGSFDSVFKEYPSINYREDYSDYNESRIIDGRKAALSLYFANKYTPSGYGSDFINPIEYGELYEYRNGKIGKKIGEYPYW